MKKWLLLLVASMVLVVAGCGDKDEDKEEKPVEEKEDEHAKDEENELAETGTGEVDEQIADEAFAVIEANNDYANAQDVEGYLKAVPADKQDETRQLIEETFAQGEIEFEILEHEYESANENEVVISVLQSTVAKEEIPGFEDNIAELVHTMQPENGEWKIFHTEVLNSEPYGEEREGTADVDEDAAEEAVQVLFDNIDYANDQDVDGYLKAIPEEDHKLARSSIETMFDEEKLAFEIVDYEVLSADEDMAEITVVQTTVAEEEVEGFDDNISEILHTLENMDGEWKIITSDILSMEPYEE